MKVLLNKTPEHTTKCICHKGFSGYSNIVARISFRVGGQDTIPQSFTAHTLDRYRQGYKTRNESKTVENLETILTN